MIRWILTLLLLSSSLFTLPVEPQLLPTTEADPDTIIDKRVSVLTGDYCEASIDAVLEGPDALVLQRYYSSRSYLTGASKGRWRLFTHCYLVLGESPKNNSSYYGYLGERSGGILPFSGNRTELKLSASKQSGITNTAYADISGKTNLSNHSLQFKQGAWELHCGDGSIRYYAASTAPTFWGAQDFLEAGSLLKDAQHFHLTKERLPSGNLILYHYETNGSLSRIEMQNAQGKVHSWFQLDHSLSGIHIHASDGKTITYQNTGPLISKATFNFKPNDSYKYSPKGQLLSKSIEQGPKITIEYDSKGRVSLIKEVKGNHRTAFITHHFSYLPGSTEVLNALGHKKCYSHSNYFLKAISFYDINGNLFRKTCKFWDPKGRLEVVTLENGKGETLSHQQYSYDAFGNILEEQLVGNLTGKNQKPLQVEGEKLLHFDPEDCHVKRYQYTQDGFNLLASLGDVKNNSTEYHYYPNTNLLKAKYTYDSKYKKVRLRHFFKYNEDAALIETLEDDGQLASCESSPKASVTTTRKTLIKPKQQLPAIGKAEAVESWAQGKNQAPFLLSKIQFYYNAQGQEVQSDLFDAHGQFIGSTFKEYDSHFQLCKITDLEGITTALKMDKWGRCLESSRLQRKFSYAYDPHGRITKVDEQSGSYHFTSEYAYDLLGRKIWETDRQGRRHDYDYDTMGYLAKEQGPQLLNEEGKAYRPTRTFVNDLLGRRLISTDENGYKLIKSYNLRGSPLTIDYPDQSYEIFKYDAEGSLHRHLTRTGTIHIYSYDFKGRVSAEEIHFILANGYCGKIKDINNTYDAFNLIHTTDSTSSEFFTYDAAGRLIEYLKPNGPLRVDDQYCQKQSFEYDSKGQIKTKKVWSDLNDYFIEKYYYDILNRPLEESIYNASGKLIRSERHHYEKGGNLQKKQTLIDGQYLTTFEASYDALGNPTLTLDAERRPTYYQYNYHHRDSQGQAVLQKMVTDSSGATSLFTYDAYDQLVSKVSNHHEQHYCYDAHGNLTVEKEGSGKQFSINRFFYGPMNRIEERVEHYGTREQQRRFYHYDKMGRLKEVQEGLNKQPLVYSYNQRGQFIHLKHASTDPSQRIDHTYVRNNEGHIIQAVSAQGLNITRSYNKQGQVTKETINDNGQGYTLLYDHDRLGRIKSITLPDQSKIAYLYEGPEGKSVQRYDTNGQLLYQHDYQAYDTHGKSTQESLILNAGTSSSNYTLTGEFLQRQSPSSEQWVPEGGLDKSGKLLALRSEGLAAPPQQTFLYNEKNELIQEGHTLKYDYDSRGNCIKNARHHLDFDAANRVQSVDGLPFEYDTYGFLKKSHRGDHKFNILGQLVQFQKHGQHHSYRYDPFGRRISKQVSHEEPKQHRTPNPTLYLWALQLEIGSFENQKLEELRIPGLTPESILTREISGQRQLSNKAVALEIQNKLYLPTYDFKGSTLALFDAHTKNLVESYHYDAFGNETIFDAEGIVMDRDESKNPWRYASWRCDPETGYINFPGRSYDPDTCRWLTPDPLYSIDGINRYRYCKNNPLLYTDPYGYNSELPSQENREHINSRIEQRCPCYVHRTCRRGGDLGLYLCAIPTIGGPGYISCLLWDHYLTAWESRVDNYIFNRTYNYEYLFENKSRFYQLSDEEAFDPNPMDYVGFINGINNSFEEAQASLAYLGNISSIKNMHGIYNASHGIGDDLKEAAINLGGFRTDPSQKLIEKWDEHFARNPNAPFIIICHSQGVIHTLNALRYYDQSKRKKILVIAIAPPVAIPTELCRDVTHIVSTRDPVPIIASKFPEGTVIRLDPHPEAPWIDHPLQSPTYRDAIANTLRRYIKNYISTN